VKFRDRINDLRSVLSGLGYSNVSISVAFVTNGLTGALSDEFKQEQKHILDKYDNETFAGFSFEPWGADELITRINMLEKKNKKIDADIPIRYDANNPSLIKYHAGGLKGLVCSTGAKEIAKLVLGDSTGSIFDSNIRRFLGTRGAVNTDIIKTCTDTSISHQFWFLNNGLTVICDSLDPVTDPDNPHVKLKNMQIVNGCQTASALAMAEKDNALAADTRVLLRIYEAADAQLIDKIVLTTNNQNKISSRDLRSNDKTQLDTQEGFKKYNFYYERKVNQYGSDVSVARIIVNETVAQSYLAIVLKNHQTPGAENIKCGVNFTTAYLAVKSLSHILWLL
jgi:AIPR protein